MGKIKLFCLPYAGGSAAIYKSNNWDKYLDDSIELEPVELAGRGKRSNEKLYTNLNEAVDDIYRFIKTKMNESEYAIYGHSMGGILAFELYYKIKESNLKEPVHIFFSGRRPPHINNKKNIHKLSGKEFEKEVFKLGGTSKEVLENRELLDFFIPIIRADFKIIEGYKYVQKKEKINCSISVLGGKYEEFTNHSINQWERYTSENCYVYVLNGNHFFINQKTKEVINIINNTLSSKYSIE